MTHPTTMIEKVEKYLAFRRGLGYQLRTEGRLLQQFARHADAAGHIGPLTTELALRWARLPATGAPLYWARRLEIVRCFARHLAAIEPGTQIPSGLLLGPSHRRTAPYIFSEVEIGRLVTAAGCLGPPNGIRPRTYTTLIGLLTSAGLRISEALRLTRADFNAIGDVITIRETKFGKSRFVPLHATTTTALVAYTHDRDRLVPRPQSDHFFLSNQGEGLSYWTVRTVFRKLCDGLRITGAGKLPVVAREERITAHISSHHGHAPFTSRGGHNGNCIVAGARESRDNASIR